MRNVHPRRVFHKHRALHKSVQPVVDQIKPIVHETLKEVYKPLLDKLTSIDEKLGKITMSIEDFSPKSGTVDEEEEIQLDQKSI
tara:strand:+ start:4155 stop:4406 length:252 start_codon:yes stop_codon:yes gene_type:complete